MKALIATNVSNSWEVTQTLRKVRADVFYFERLHNKRMIMEVYNILMKFLSTNQSHLDENEDFVHMRSKFHAGLGSIAKQCKELV